MAERPRKSRVLNQRWSDHVLGAVLEKQMSPHEPQDRDAEGKKIAELRRLRLARHYHPSAKSVQQCIDETDHLVTTSMKLLATHERD